MPNRVKPMLQATNHGIDEVKHYYTNIITLIQKLNIKLVYSSFAVNLPFLSWFTYLIIKHSIFLPYTN